MEVTVGRERGGLQVVDRLLAPAVTASLDEIELEPEDAAAAKLAERYAREIDQADAAAAQADKVLRQIDDEDFDTRELVSALKAKLGARTAVSDLGPKLLAALAELGATPKARAAARKGGAARAGKGGNLAALRASRTG